MGAWIETANAAQTGANAQSHPIWVRGLKHNYGCIVIIATAVAPHMGAWIETPHS